MLAPQACPIRSSTGSERLILADPPGSRSIPDPGSLCLRDSGPSRQPKCSGPRGSAPLGLHHRDSAYCIRTQPTSSGFGPRSDSPGTANLGAMEQCPGVPPMEQQSSPPRFCPVQQRRCFLLTLTVLIIRLLFLLPQLVMLALSAVILSAVRPWTTNLTA